MSSTSQIKLLENLMLEIIQMKECIEELNRQMKHPSLSMEDQLWTVDQVADYLQKSKGTIQSHYQNKHGFPPSRKIGSKRYWKPKEIIAYAQRL